MGPGFVEDFGDFHLQSTTVLGCYRPVVMDGLSTPIQSCTHSALRSCPIEFAGFGFDFGFGFGVGVGLVRLLTCFQPDTSGAKGWAIFRYLRKAIRVILVDYMTNLWSLIVDNENTSSTYLSYLPTWERSQWPLTVNTILVFYFS